MSAPFTFTRRCALFQSLTFPDCGVVFTQAAGAPQDDNYTVPGYVRVSEWQDTTYKPLDQDHSKAVVDALLAERREVETNYVAKINDIDGRVIRAMAAAPVNLESGK